MYKRGGLVVFVNSLISIQKLLMRNNSSLNPRKSNLVNEKLCLIFLDRVSVGLWFNLLGNWGISHLYEMLKDKWTNQ